MWSYFGAVLPDSAGRIDEHRSKRRLVRGGWLFIDIIVDSGVTNHGGLGSRQTCYYRGTPAIQFYLWEGRSTNLA